MDKKNCWEMKKCGRQPGGEKTGELGVCPVTKYLASHGINSGVNGGRACWVIGGTFCGGTVQGTYSQKMGGCMKCEFYSQVRQEEGPDYKGSREIINLLDDKNRSA
jgi:hypothetical protein